jgi:hypothetical protein
MTVKAIDGQKSDDDLWNSIEWKEISNSRLFAEAYREGSRRFTAGCFAVPYQCLSPVRRKSHAGFLGGDGAARSRLYPTPANSAGPQNSTLSEKS